MAVAAYRRFRADCKGWVVVGFPEFRDFYEPLRKRRVWSETEGRRVQALADAGGAYAIRVLYGKGAAREAMELYLGERGKEPDALTREELEAQMKALTANCARADWSPQTFHSFGRYLDSDKGPDSLTDSEPEPSAPLMSQATKARAVESKMAGDAPARDLFAEMYRAASPVFRAAVQACLREGAQHAAEALQKKSAQGTSPGGEPASMPTAAHIQTLPVLDPVSELLTAFGPSVSR